jgi:hypothetical protein
MISAYFLLARQNSLRNSLSQIINEKYQVWVAHHMTHIDNLSSILGSGELRSYNLMRGTDYRNLANDDVQAGRAAIVIPATGKPLHDYVPLYLGFKTPMVATNQMHNADIVFLRFSLDILSAPGSVICDGNARSNVSRFHLFNGPDTFGNLDIQAIRSVKYGRDSELKRKKQAEVLIADKLPISNLLDVICYDENARTRVLSVMNQFGIRRGVKVNQGWYFINSPLPAPKDV